MKLWKKGAWLKSKIPESVSDETGQLPKRLVQAQAGHFQNGVSESSLPRRASGAAARELAAQLRSGGLIDLPIGAQHHSVIAACAGFRHDSTTDVGQHQLGRTLERTAIAAGAGPLDQDHVA